jgi:hypothetical protein
MEALVAADAEYRPIRQATRGIIFLATPFRGTSFRDVADWAEPLLGAWASIRGQQLSRLIASLKESTVELEELVRKFTRLCQDKDHPYRVSNFYETKNTSLVPVLTRPKLVREILKRCLFRLSFCVLFLW